MIKLYGSPISNYYNMVKLALLEKGFDFEEVPASPGREPDHLARSPMGKIPCIEADEGFLSETDAILEFLEDITPEMPLYPEDAYRRAKVRQIMYIAEKYVDNAVRPLLRSYFGGSPLPVERLDEVKEDLSAGLAALGRLARFEPWIAGDVFTYADITAYYAVQVAAYMAETAVGRDIYSEMPALAEWRGRVAERPFVRQVDATQREALAALKAQTRD